MRSPKLVMVFLLVSISSLAQNYRAPHSKHQLDDQFFNVTLKEIIYNQLIYNPLVKDYYPYQLANFYSLHYEEYKSEAKDYMLSSGIDNWNDDNLKPVIDEAVNHVIADFLKDERIDEFKRQFELPERIHDHDDHDHSAKKGGGGPNNKGPGQPCNNADFEMCNFTGWDLYEGNVNNTPYGYVGVTPTAPGTQHTITTPGVDPIVGIPTTDPNGGGCSVMLGDATGTGAKAASIEQTFLVTPATASFTYSYALVLQDPSGHTVGEKPYFKINMYDQNGNTIQCGDYSVIAGPVGQGGDPDFVAYAGGFYLPWRTTFAPLNAYIGQNVTIEFIVGDCSQSGHYGYGYIEASCDPLEIIPSDTLTCNGNPITLTAPAGAASYLWSPGGQTTQSMTLPVFNLSPSTTRYSNMARFITG